MTGSRSLPEGLGTTERLPAEAYCGLAGDFVRTVEPETEADPGALLVQFLTAFGNAVGPGPHYLVERDIHRMNLFSVLVGHTASARKGISWGHVRSIMSTADPRWAAEKVASGLSTGEGLIWAVRDSCAGDRRGGGRPQGSDTGCIVEDAAVDDKRLLVVESEFSSVLRMFQREGNTLSAVMRDAWDRGDLRTLTKNSPVRTTGAHISIIGHITREELLRYLNRTEMANGFANRILWVNSRRSRHLPDGGQLTDEVMAPVRDRLVDAIQHGKAVGRIQRDPDAARVWRAVYEDLNRDRFGLTGALLSRAPAQVTRLSCLFALLDCRAEVAPSHLNAALALWEHSERSVSQIFGNSLGDPIADAILQGLRGAEAGLTRTAIRNLLGRNKGAVQIEQALRHLDSLRLARCEVARTGGRPEERWFAILPAAA